MKNFLTYFFIYVFAFLSDASAQKEKDVDSLILKFAGAKAEAQDALLEEISSILRYKDTAYAREKFQKIVSITAAYHTDDRLLYKALSLIYYSYYCPLEYRIPNLKLAFETAKKIEDYKVMGIATFNMNDVYRNMLLYDSAMICLWDAKKYFEEANSTGDVLSTYYRIGDYYYDADLLDKAEAIYKDVLRTGGKGIEIPWRNYIYVVLTNNLGLIEVKRKNYSKAEEYFLTTMNYKLSSKGGKLDKHDTTQLAYIYYQMGKVNYLQNRFDAAEDYYRKSLAFTQSVKWDAYASYLYLLKSKLLLHYGKNDSALIYLRMADELNKKSSFTGRTIEIYHAFGEAYRQMNDNKNALEWYRKYQSLNDSISINKRAAAFLQIKAEKENELNLKEIDNLKRERIRLFITGLLLVLGFTITLLIFRKKKHADKLLVNKNIEISDGDTQSRILEQSENEPQRLEVIEQPILSIEPAKETDEPQIKFAKIISKIEKVIIEDKLYLSRVLNMDELAQKLEVNRSYLSSAVNQVYKENFNSFINELRVKDSIKLMTTKESSMLSIEGIAKEVGFNNRASFITAFKKYTGVTPSYFIKKMKKNA